MKTSFALQMVSQDSTAFLVLTAPKSAAKLGEVYVCLATLATSDALAVIA